jgi:threonyl-tRNA synthetase
MNIGYKPMLPLWLSPIQIRFIPVSRDYVPTCDKLIDNLNKKSTFIKIRADIDDREESVGRKIRDAEKEWTPIIIVIGEKESTHNTFIPRFRDSTIGEDKKEFTLDELFTLISDITTKYPQKQLPLPIYMSKRPKFK